MDFRREVTATNLIAGLILLVGILRLFVGNGADDQLGETTLFYFFGAAAVFLLARTKTFKFGQLEFELDQLKSEVKSARLEAGIAADAAKLGIVPGAASLERLAEAPEIRPGEYHDDPWKGVFGGKSTNAGFGRVLSAKVESLLGQPGWYSVTLEVSRVSESSLPLRGGVQFFLHDSFHNDRPIVEAVNGQAILRLKAWGAFTVGVLCDEGNCQLELDLAGLDTAPMEFRLR